MCSSDLPAAKPKLCFIGCPHLSLAQLKAWTERLEKFGGKLKVSVIMTCAPGVAKKFENFLDQAGILEYEKVAVVDVNNGERFETYTIAGERGSGIICLNGAAARCACVGDKVIIMAYALADEQEARAHKPQVIFLGEGNRVERVTNYEKHGRLKDCFRV